MAGPWVVERQWRESHEPCDGTRHALQRECLDLRSAVAPSGRATRPTPTPSRGSPPLAPAPAATIAVFPGKYWYSEPMLTPAAALPAIRRPAPLGHGPVPRYEETW
jgi:hypothetical protein